MKKLLVLVLAFLVLLMLLTALFVKLMGWTGLLALFVVMVLAALYVKSRIVKFLQKAFVTPFLMKGAALKDATAEIHSVQPATRPARTFVQYHEPDNGNGAPGGDEMGIEDEGSTEYSRHFSLDVTITPQANHGAFQHWEPEELVLVKKEAHSGDTDDHEAEVGRVLNVEVWQDGAWIEDDGMKLLGPQRLRLLVGVQNSVRACRFRYYFEVFGQVELPDVPFA